MHCYEFEIEFFAAVEKNILSSWYSGLTTILWNEKTSTRPKSMLIIKLSFIRLLVCKFSCEWKHTITWTREIQIEWTKERERGNKQSEH